MVPNLRLRPRVITVLRVITGTLLLFPSSYWVTCLAPVFDNTLNSTTVSVNNKSKTKTQITGYFIIRTQRKKISFFFFFFVFLLVEPLDGDKETTKKFISSTK